MKNSHSANPNVFEQLQKFVGYLKTDERLAKILSDVNLIKSERQPRNLGSLLTHSYFGKSMFDFGVTKCGGKRCITCSYIEGAPPFTFHTLTPILKSNISLTVIVAICYIKSDARAVIWISLGVMDTILAELCVSVNACTIINFVSSTKAIETAIYINTFFHVLGI